jgi:hypothetical protein
MREQTQQQPNPCGCGESHCEAVRTAVAQYFGSIGNASVLTSFPQINTPGGTEWTAGARVQRLWRIVSTVAEVQRHSGQENFLTPLSEAAILQLGNSRSLLKLRIKVSEMGFEDGLGGRTFVIDAGSSLELWGAGVDVAYLKPAAVSQIQSPALALQASNSVIDGLIGVQILGIEAPLGHGAPLTDYRGVAAGDTLALTIPQGAKDVTIYQSAAGAASLTWQWFYGDPSGGLNMWPLGDLPFIAGQRRTHTISVVPGATHIVSDVAALTDRFFTVVWTIRP